jgi:hypothetical protein
MDDNWIQQKTVKLFLLDGNPRGVKTIKMSNWNGRGFIVPRSELNSFFQTEETEIQANLESPCLYFLIGQSENEFGKQKVYIGQTESIKNRIIYHDKQKEFWNYLLFFISIDKELNSGHIKHLETLCINYAKQYKRCILDNTQLGNLNSLSLEDKAFVIEFLINIKTILSSIGYRFLEPIVELSEDKIVSNPLIKEKPSEEVKVYYLNKGKVKARGTYISDGFVVLSGSIISKKGYETNKVFTDKVSFVDNALTTTEDIIFTSPSQASTMILGYPDNGRDSWKDENGKSIKENQAL